MKIDKTAAVFAAFLGVYALVRAALGFEVAWLLLLAIIPFFCVQLLCCLTKRWRTRILPVVLIAPLAGWALFYYLCDGKGDYLAPLVLVLGCIAPVLGAALAWGLWWFCDYRKRAERG